MNFRNNVFAIDATMIDMSQSSSWWEKFRTSSDGKMVHTQHDLKTAITEYINISPDNFHEINVTDLISY
jgi:hypothetical protein